MGIPTYGKTFTLADESVNGVGAPAIAPGEVGNFVPEVGFIGYNEICYTEWSHRWRAEQQAPYAVRGNQWVGYDDIESVAIKLDYILANDLGGVMYWSLETDDFG